MSETDTLLGELDEFGDGGEILESVLGDVDGVETLLDEAETMLESIDFAELPDAIDEDEVLEAVEIGEIPAALRDSEHEEVVKLRQVMRAIDARELLGAADVGDLWEAKRGFDDAVDDLANGDDDGDDGLAEKAAKAVTDDDGDDGENGLVQEAAETVTDDEELIETEVDEMLETGAREAMEDFDLQDGDLSEYETLIQQQAIEGVDAFRDGLLRTHGGFEQVVEFNRERTRNIDRRPNSRNPTAVSTIVTDRGDLATTPNYATMPRNVRHSNAPSRKHIYGRRFELERKRRGYDDD